MAPLSPPTKISTVCYSSWRPRGIAPSFCCEKHGIQWSNDGVIGNFSRIRQIRPWRWSNDWLTQGTWLPWMGRWISKNFWVVNYQPRSVRLLYSYLLNWFVFEFGYPSTCLWTTCAVFTSDCLHSETSTVAFKLRPTALPNKWKTVEFLTPLPHKLLKAKRIEMEIEIQLKIKIGTSQAS